MATGEPLRWLLANAELDRVLEQSADARAAHLASLRARDRALAADVESLLAEHDALDAAGLLEPASASVTTPTSEGASTAAVRVPGRVRDPLAPGTVLGPYRIVGRLGRGGMGTVYEADEIDSGRRIALKVLEERLHDPRERERFEREGRLAASLNHPHCVFVFAAAEIDGRLTIAMERMQGTLADRLKTQGPLPPAAAVDAALQLIAGLQAAAAIGILHRDVKPSNCFVDADGVIKIGDFGISRSLRPTEETALSTRTRFAATPAYASPEQLRGAALDARADIYSLGATLYELLTGRPPFERDDLMALLMAVANDAPKPPHRLVPAVPVGLSQVILRCLAKRPEQRFSDYGTLTEALEPYSSVAPKPATLGRRFFAGFIDHCVLLLLTALVATWWWGLFVPTQGGALLHPQAAWFVILLAYFGTAESVWAATPGKTLVGLTLVDSKGRPPDAARAVARAALFAAVWTLGGVLGVGLNVALFNPRSMSVVELSLMASNSVFSWLLLAAVFSTARRRNGYVGWHDLATGTRIVERKSARADGKATRDVPATTMRPTAATLEPFHATEQAIAGMPVGWRRGFDDRLRRAVWIRQVAPGTSPLDAARITLMRPTRLRWLAGRRTSSETWDAFEAASGVPLEQACARRPAWADVRWWLLDLARECAAQTPEDRPPLRADRVWVLDRGGATLVDDPAVDRAEGAVRAAGTCANLLLEVVHAARGSSPRPWPLTAQRFLDRLRLDPLPTDDAIVRELESLTRQRAVLTRGWRAVHMLALVAFPLMSVGINAVMRTSLASSHYRLPHEVRVVSSLLGEIKLEDQGLSTLSSQDLEAIEVALASAYRHVLTDPRLFTQEYGFVGQAMRTQIERMLRRKPTAAEGRRAREHALVQAIVKTPTYATAGAGTLSFAGKAAILMLGRALTFVALFSFVAGLAFRGGLMRAMGLELVNAAGRPASRVRVLTRTLIAWAPIIALRVASPGVSRIEFVASALAVLVLLAGAITAIARPERGVQDRLAGTWIVPR